MTPGLDNTDDPVRAMWATEEEASANAFDEDCSPTRVCRNARAFSFEGIAVEGGDLQAAWRDRLEREGKLNHSAESIHDLVFGQTASD